MGDQENLQSMKSRCSHSHPRSLPGTHGLERLALESSPAGRKSLQLLKGIGLACLLVALPARGGAQTSYTATDLGVLPGHVGSFALGLNDAGVVVGYSYSATTTLGFVWRDGVLTSTGLLPSGIYSTAQAVNQWGVVVGEGDTGNLRPQAWVSTATGLYNFFPNNGGNTHVVGISGAGVICGYYTKSLSGWVNSWRGALWTPDPRDPRKYRLTQLPVLIGIDPKYKGTAALPTAANENGETVGYATNEVIGQHACFWKNDAGHTIVDLGTLGPEGSASYAFDVNDAGEAVGVSMTDQGNTIPTLWLGDAGHTMVELPRLPGDIAGRAGSINNAGQVVGESTRDATLTRPVIWQDGQVQELAPLVEPASSEGWTFTSVLGINNRGQIIGAGLHNGAERAFLLSPR